MEWVDSQLETLLISDGQITLERVLKMGWNHGELGIAAAIKCGQKDILRAKYPRFKLFSCLKFPIYIFILLKTAV